MTTEIMYGDASYIYRIAPSDSRVIERKLNQHGERWEEHTRCASASQARSALLRLEKGHVLAAPARKSDTGAAPIRQGQQETMISLTYDYGKVDSSVRDIVETAAVEIKLRERRAAEDTVAIGKHLMAVKELLPYGQFGEWIETEFGYSASTAKEFMLIAQRFGGRTPIIGVLRSTVLRLLASPSVPDDVIDAVVERTETQGRPLQVREVKAIRDTFRRAAIAVKIEWTDSERERLIQVKRGRTVLANLQHDHALIAWAQSQGMFERIDRATIWGNPFVVDEDGTREQCILKYEDYYYMKSSLWPKLESLRGKVLGCWCYPEDCHGHVLINFLNFDAGNPFESLGFGYPIGTPDDFERFTEMHATWAALHYLEEHR